MTSSHFFNLVRIMYITADYYFFHNTKKPLNYAYMIIFGDNSQTLLCESWDELPIKRGTMHAFIPIPVGVYSVPRRGLSYPHHQTDQQKTLVKNFTNRYM